MRVFPQPATDVATLEYSLSELSWVSLEIVNTMGQVLISEPTRQQSSGLQRVTIPTEGLGQGVYFLRVNMGGKIATIPFQVMR